MESSDPPSPASSDTSSEISSSETVFGMRTTITLVLLSVSRHSILHMLPFQNIILYLGVVLQMMTIWILSLFLTRDYSAVKVYWSSTYVLGFIIRAYYTFFKPYQHKCFIVICEKFPSGSCSFSFL